MAGFSSFMMLLGCLIGVLVFGQLEENATEVDQYSTVNVTNSSLSDLALKTFLDAVNASIGFDNSTDPETEAFLARLRPSPSCYICGMWVLDDKGEIIGDFVKGCDCDPDKKCRYLSTAILTGGVQIDRFGCQQEPTNATTPVAEESSRNDATTGSTSSLPATSSEALTVPSMGSRMTRPSAEEATEPSSEMEATTGTPFRRRSLSLDEL